MNLFDYLITAVRRGLRAGCRAEVNAVLIDAMRLEYSLSRMERAISSQQDRTPTFRMIGGEERDGKNQ